MKTIKQILAEKTKPLTTVAPEDTVQHALELMRDRDIGAVYIPNLPFWFAEGPYALKTYAFGYYYGDHYAVPAVTAREMVVTAHRGKPEFAGWVDRSVASAADTAGGRALELELTMPNASFPVVAPVGQLGGPH